jgi:hypothetical protein
MKNNKFKILLTKHQEIKDHLQDIKKQCKENEFDIFETWFELIGYIKKINEMMIKEYELNNIDSSEWFKWAFKEIDHVLRS